MANIIISQRGQLPSNTLTRYRDVGDGTHALVVNAGRGSGANDIILRHDGEIPGNLLFLFKDMGDGTHAKTWALTVS